MERKFLYLLVALLWPHILHAQTAAITGFELQVYAAGVDPAVGAPMQTNTIPLTSTGVTCNLVPSAAVTGTIANPRSIEWDDPWTPGRICRADGAAFLALPLGSGYRVTLTALSSSGPSDRSAASAPFAVSLQRPAAPKGVAVK